jgi:hypothetical protein
MQYSSMANLQIIRQMSAEFSSIVLRTMDVARLSAAHEGQAHLINARCNDSAVMANSASPIENG